MLMKFILISWRSVLRNKRRTAITGMAVGLGLASLMFTDALYAGMMDYMLQGSTETWMGHGQIHGEGFHETARVTITVRDLPEVIRRLDRDSLVQAYTGRLISPASLESSREMKPVTLIGVDRGTDPEVTGLENSVIEGNYFTGDSTEMIVGEKLAEDMELIPGDIAVVTAAMADSGLASQLFIVSGICRFGSEKLDEYSVFVNLSSSENLLGLRGELHEIAFLFPDPGMAANGEMPNYGGRGNTTKGWPELAPQIHSMTGMVDVSLTVMSIILFGLVLFGIINSLFMSIYERMYEFGIMRAVGTGRSTVVFLVLLEAFWLGVIAALFGFLTGWGVIQYFAGAGISFGDFDFSGIMFDQPIYPDFRLGSQWIYPLFTIVFTTLAGVYPGLHAGGLNPARAIRKSL